MQGSVRKALHIPTGKLVVAKITRIDDIEMKFRFINELTMLSRLNDCKYIVNLEDSFVCNNKGIMIMERMPFDLMTLIEENKLTSLADRLRIFQLVCLAIRECHKRGIAHLDIKPENILVSEDFAQIKICDFGNSQFVDDDGMVDSKSGTFLYCCPEYFSGRKFDGKKADIWSLGVLFHVLLTDLWPYDYSNNVELKTAVYSGNVSAHPSITQAHLKLFSQMTRKDTEERLNIDKVCSALKRASSQQIIPQYVNRILNKLR